MEPVNFDEKQLAILPPHHVVTYAKDQPEYRPLPSVRIDGPEGRVISRWQLTAEERARLAAGEDLFIEVWTFGGPLQPMLPTIDLRVLCPQEPNV